MTPLLYGELVPWYWLLDPPSDHADEATCYGDVLSSATPSRPRTLLELGAGAGNNALYLKQRYECTLSDLSEPMLGLSRRQNPECRHVQGDMRSLRLAERFDAVFIHDAICYLTTPQDLRAALETAFVHTRPGGVTLVAPDYFAEDFEEHSALYEGSDGERALRCLEWTWDRDASDHEYSVEYAFLLRDGASLRAVHDHHREGLFSRPLWLDLLTSVGFQAQLVQRPLDDGGLSQMLLALRPAS